ncbi:MAG: heat-inducible transcription repressor HrcA [Acidobacteria bacterium]|nr:heat-inducible transcription repressor HrcA [Acidobacteriota bacterium]
MGAKMNRAAEFSDSLDQRSREMLALLIRTHVATGEPVGSRTISKLSSEGLSAATVRNIIADLEDSGFLESPHTSAGRIPSDKGYRFFVDHMIDREPLAASDESEIKMLFRDQPWPSADHLMSRASQLLSRISNHVGIVISPNIATDVIKHIDFVRVADGRILVITVTRSGIVQDRLVSIDENLSQDELNHTANYVNAHFTGMSLTDIRNELVKRLTEEKADYDQLLQNAAKLCDRGLTENGETDQEIFIDGASNIVSQSDFANLDQMRELLRVFEEKSRLIRILNECLDTTPTQSVMIRIGAENTLPSLHGCTLITTIYGNGDRIIGSLGVVGPVRMEYARTIGVVNAVARLLERALIIDQSMRE